MIADFLDAKRLTKLFFLTFFVGLALTFFTAQEAQAGWGGGSGGGVSSGGTCSADPWTVVNSLNALKGGDCSGTSDDYLRSRGGGECLAHENDIVAVFYLQGHGPNGTKMWMGRTDGGSWNSPANIKSQIETLTNNHTFAAGYNDDDAKDQIKKYAKDEATSAAVTVICVWGDLIIKKVTSEKPSVGCKNGKVAIVVPKPADGTQYTTGNGTSLDGPKRYVEGEDPLSGNWTIKQVIKDTNKYKWADGTTAAKTWHKSDFNLNKDCTIDIRITKVDCTTPNDGYFKVVFVGNDENEVRLKASGAGFTNVPDVTEGTKYDVKDGKTITWEAFLTNAAEEAKKKVVMTVNGNSVSGSSASRTFGTCNEPPGLSVRMVWVQPKVDVACSTSGANTGKFYYVYTEGSWSGTVVQTSKSGYITWASAQTGTTSFGSGSVSGSKSVTATINSSAPAGTEYADGGGQPSDAQSTVTKNSTTKITYAHNWVRKDNTNGVVAGDSCANDAAAGRQIEPQNVFVRNDCVDGSYQSTQTNTETRGPYEYSWVTVVSPGGPSVGGRTIVEPAAVQLSPLGTLLQNASENNTDPGMTAINNAVTQNGTAEHAKVDLSEESKAAIAMGGIMNVTETTTYVNLIITRTDTYDNYYTDCTPVYAHQSSYRDITYYEVKRYNKATRDYYATWTAQLETPGATTYNWNNGTRSKKSPTGSTCGPSNVPDSYSNGYYINQNNGNTSGDPSSDKWYRKTTSTCGANNGAYTYEWGDYTSWSSSGTTSQTNKPNWWDAGCPHYASDVNRDNSCSTTTGSPTYGSGTTQGGEGTTSCPTSNGSVYTASDGNRYKQSNCDTTNLPTTWTPVSGTYYGSDSGYSPQCTSSATVQCSQTTSTWDYTCQPGNRYPVVTSRAATGLIQNSNPDATIGQGLPYNVCWTQWKTEYFYNGSTTRTPTGSSLAFSSYATNTGGESQRQTAFWQAMANHCNAAGYNSAKGLKETNAEINNNDASKNYSGSAITAVQTTDNPTPTWGNGSGGTNNAGAANTNTEGFYDKECSYAGVKSAASKQPTSGLRANWTFFRDNQARDMSVYLFEPRSQGVVTYNNTDALRTLLVRWKAGTPLPAGEGVGELNVRVKGTDIPIWKNSESNPYVLTNWGASEEGSGNTWALVQGQQTTFDAAADWPNDKNKPNVFQVKWEYDPLVSNVVPTTQIGFGPGSARRYTNGTVSAAVQGWVKGLSNGDSSPATPVEYENNSGSGVATNTMDANLSDGVAVDANGEWTADPNGYSAYYYWIRFVRATGE